MPGDRGRSGAGPLPGDDSGPGHGAGGVHGGAIPANVGDHERVVEVRAGGSVGGSVLVSAARRSVRADDALRRRPQPGEAREVRHRPAPGSILAMTRSHRLAAPPPASPLPGRSSSAPLRQLGGPTATYPSGPQ